MNQGQTEPPKQQESKFPSLQHSLVEARREFDLEQQRKSDIEQKVAVIIGMNSIVVSATVAAQSVSAIVRVGVAIPAVMSIIVVTMATMTRKYHQPKPTTGESFGLARSSEQEAREQLVLNYNRAITKNRRINDRRFSKVDLAYLLTALSLILAPVFLFLMEILQ